MKLRHRDGSLDLVRPVVMGVLNVTPDSFSDGGLWFERDAAIEHALEMTAAGAALIDVGGESTRPDAEPVPESEEIERVVPVIQLLAQEVDVPISIDTRKAAVAEAALSAGAAIVNDTTGEESDGSLDAVAAAAGAGMIVMHSRGTPQTMRSLTEYEDVVLDVTAFLRARAEDLQERGVPPDAIAIDPGIGFAKTPEQSLELVRRVDEVVGSGYPVLVGTSRKSFIGALLDQPLEQREDATLATVVWAAVKGARILRVHEVGSSVRALAMANLLVADG